VKFQAIKTTLASSPAFVIDDARLVEALKTLIALQQQCGCRVLYSIKALPFMPILARAKPFVDGFSVSSLFEARLAAEVLAGQGSIHLTTPGIRADELDELSRLVTHLSFNSLTQHQQFADKLSTHASVGLRVNPKLSFLSDDRFNPCRPYSKLGADIDELWQTSTLNQLKGLHVHTVFSATDYTPIVKTVEKLRRYFGNNLAQLDWLNLGGGYLYQQIQDHRPFIKLVQQLKDDFGLTVYIEPGTSIVNEAVYLVATVLDCFISDGKSIAILDTSVNHHPEVFEYQRRLDLHEQDDKGAYSVLLAGCTCLAGDLFGEYRFKKPLAIGDTLLFKKVGAYSLIKAHRFNGYNLPDIYQWHSGQLTPLKHYTYQDYRQQWRSDE
jgi:carboxynorspermidine decarboxylase